MTLMQEMDTEEVKSEGKTQVYELGYLLIPTIKEEDLGVSYSSLKDLLVSLGGEIISDEMPKALNLAYPMSKVILNVRHKFTTAYFGWTKFVMAPAQVLELKKRLDLDQSLIRFLILKTVKENTIAAKRFVRGETYRRPKTKSAENQTAIPINKEEIDKEIEAMVSA